MTDSSPRRFSLVGRLLFLCILMAFLGPALVIGLYLAPGPLTENQTVVIPHGTSIHEIANLLCEKNIIRSSLVFRIAAKFTANDNLKAGEYEYTPRESIADIILNMHEGHSVVHMFTVAEGLTSAEVTTLLNNNPILSGNLSIPPEGSMLPETYRYSYGDARAIMVTRMQKAMQEAVNDLWPKRDPAVPLKSPQEAIILASIVEKETGKAVERPRIAAVFYNRLRINMRLQSDPTVIYAIQLAKGPMDHDLGHDDLAFQSPYNTYTSDGLPPHPICNPGRASLEAVLHPEQNDFLYFVADGTGGHVFSRDLAAHNQNVTKWNAVKARTP